MQFSKKMGKIVNWRPSLGNPGSATECEYIYISGKKNMGLNNFLDRKIFVLSSHLYGMSLTFKRYLKRQRDSALCSWSGYKDFKGNPYWDKSGEFLWCDRPWKGRCDAHTASMTWPVFPKIIVTVYGFTTFGCPHILHTSKVTLSCFNR